MRTLKFRAWDKERKNWQYFTLMELITGQGSIIYPKLDHWCEFTGLRDRRGVEIYEGDVVTHDNGAYLVIWLEGRSGFAWKIIKPSRYEPAPMMAVVQPNSEVIGNIYEHPELLEVKK